MYVDGVSAQIYFPNFNPCQSSWFLMCVLLLLKRQWTTPIISFWRGNRRCKCYLHSDFLLLLLALMWCCKMVSHKKRYKKVKHYKCHDQTMSMSWSNDVQKTLSVSKKMPAGSCFVCVCVFSNLFTISPLHTISQWLTRWTPSVHYHPWIHATIRKRKMAYITIIIQQLKLIAQDLTNTTLLCLGGSTDFSFPQRVKGTSSLKACFAYQGHQNKHFKWRFSLKKCPIDFISNLERVSRVLMNKIGSAKCCQLSYFACCISYPL